MTDQGETEIQGDPSGDVGNNGETRHRRSVQRAAEREVKRRTWSFYAYWGLLLVALLLAIWVIATGTERTKDLGTSAVAMVKGGLGTDPDVLEKLAENIDQETTERLGAIDSRLSEIQTGGKRRDEAPVPLDLRVLRA